MDPASRAAMLDIARVIRLRTGQLMTALETLEEIAVREHVTVAGVLDRPEIRRIAGGPGSAPSRASALLEALRTFATLCLKKNAGADLRSEVSALKLPRGISVVLPKELGSDESHGFATGAKRRRTGASARGARSIARGTGTDY